MRHDRISFSKRAYIYSLFFHGALFILMLNIPVLFEVEVPKIYELSLGAVSQQRVEQIIEEARRAEIARRLQEEGMLPQERVEVPKRKMIEIEEPAISVPAENRIESHDIITNAERQTFEVQSPDFRVPESDGSIFSMDRKESFQGSKISIGEQPGAGIETSKVGADLEITIDGEIKGRDIVSNPKPVYPEGHNKNAVIKIRITVLPNGSVSAPDMTLVRKEDAVLEDLTLNTLKLWRWSPLTAGDERKQTGTITFDYKVK